MIYRALFTALALLLGAASVQAQQLQALAVTTCGTPGRTIVAGTLGPITLDTSGRICGISTAVPSGTQAVNLTQILGAAPSATNPIWVSPATASTPWIITGSGTAGTAATGVVTVQGIASMTPLLVTLSGTNNIATVTTVTTVGAVTAITNALPVGANVIGKVSIDQTTPGTTNAVQPIGAFAIVGITPADRTVTSATGASQTLMAANAARHGLVAQNTGNANCGVNPTGGTAVIGGAGTLTLVPNGSYQPNVPTLSAITIICTAGQPFYAEEN